MIHGILPVESDFDQMPTRRCARHRVPLERLDLQVTQDDFRKAKEKALYRKKSNEPQGLYL